MMTIGEVIKVLGQADHALEIRFDFARLVPRTIISWRGIYAEPALTWATREEAGAQTVGELLEKLKEALDGRTFEGYKGGHFVFRSSSPLHIDNYGKYTETEIDRIEIDEVEVIIHTKRG